ncbi:hypothetical protein KR009_008959 [Drosophila setifemur]|nr:hypothetical protein KR009_008959 [Drosophila setifemur]
MKASLFASVILVTIFFLSVYAGNNSTTDDGFGFQNSSKSVNSSKIRSRRSQNCQRKILKSCTSTAKSCGRLGRANICESFPNDCQRQISNCQAPKKFYQKAHQSLCRGLPYNVLRPCGSGSKSLDTFN